MLYQYLLDEVGRKQVKVVRRADRGDDIDDEDGVALQKLDDFGPGRRRKTGQDTAGQGGANWFGSWGAGMGMFMGGMLGLGAGEPGRKSTGLGLEGLGMDGVRDGHREDDVPVISRSRSERQTGGATRKSRATMLRRVMTGQEKDVAVVAVEDDEFTDDDFDDELDELQSPVLAARAVRMHELVRRDKRLTM
jgi:hypothetical protein